MTTNAAIAAFQSNASRRTNPIIEQLVQEIGEIVTENGYADGSDYELVIKKYKIADEIVLPALEQNGFGFVRTKSIQYHPEIEVIVDLKMMAAAMLLIYSDDTYALQNPVLKFLEAVHTAGTWRAAFPLSYHKGLLEDVYTAYGHNFTDQVMAEAAIIDPAKADEQEQLAQKQALRHVHALVELAKRPKELLAVFGLSISTFDALNAAAFRSAPGTEDIYHRHMENPGAYEHFFRLSVNKILTPHRHVRNNLIVENRWSRNHA